MVNINGHLFLRMFYTFLTNDRKVKQFIRFCHKFVFRTFRHLFTVFQNNEKNKGKLL